MVFGSPHFRRKEEAKWNQANEAGKELLLEQWFQEMLEEGRSYYDRPTAVFYIINLTRKKMETVMLSSVKQSETLSINRTRTTSPMKVQSVSLKQRKW
jgi:hypothetical protein